jgi:hypothetical protein
MKKVNISACVSEELGLLLRNLAAEEELTISELLREILTEYVRKILAEQRGRG